MLQIYNSGAFDPRLFHPHIYYGMLHD